MSKSKTRDKRLILAKEMPPLAKKNNSGEYCAAEDRTLKWIAAQPTLQSYLLDLLVRIGYIAYNREAGAWKGVDYHD